MKTKMAKENPKILVTGGAGYIGSHTCVELLAAGYELVVVDNFSNSKPIALERVQKIVGKNLVFHQADVRNRETLREVFRQHAVQSSVSTLPDSSLWGSRWSNPCAITITMCPEPWHCVK